MRIIVETFRHDPLAEVCIRLAEEIESFKVAFAEQHPLLNDCWATMDGLKLYLQTAGNTYIQERFYNGWTICLKMLVLLYNMHARMVGINQIRNTYTKHLTRNANEDVPF